MLYEYDVLDTFNRHNKPEHLRETLNKMAANGWRFVHMDDTRIIFEREYSGDRLLVGLDADGVKA